MNIETLRVEFERQHAGRNLTKHKLRGTYVSAPTAALWNQHLRTAKWVEHLSSPDQNETLRTANKVLLENYQALKATLEPSSGRQVVRHVVITGNVIEGTSLWGPFVTCDEADEWAERECDDYLIADLRGPL